MNWEAIGAIGEVVGAAAVVITLLVLVVQVRQNNRGLEESNRLNRAATIDRHADSISRWRGRLMENTELSRIWLSAVEGKVVNKLMVNGKDFFDGDTKLASKNIPSKAVDKVQVLRNYAEVGQLRSVRNNQDNVAINIKLKEGKENFWFGDVTAGAGASPEDALYVVQPKLFYYSPKYTVNIIGDFNNTGDIALNRRDIRNLGGGFRVPSRTSGTDISLGNNDLSFLTDQNNTLEIESKLATANFSYSPTSSLDLSGFLIYNSSRILSRETSLIRYTDPELGIPEEATEQFGRERSEEAVVKLSASFQPNFNNQIDYDVLARTSSDQQRQLVNSSVIGATDRTDDFTPYSINQNLNYYYTLNENNIFAFEAQHLVKDEDPFYNAILTNDPNGVDSFDTTARLLPQPYLLENESHKIQICF